MKEFKLWLDNQDFLKFNYQTSVMFGQCNRNKVLSLQELLRLTSDIAVEDFGMRNMDRKTMLDAGFMILLSRTAFRIHKMPAENQEITVTTWEEKGEALQFMRTYEITDSKTGEKLITELSSWLLVDVNTRRLLPIKKFTLRPPVELTMEHDCFKPAKIQETENMQLLAERKISFTDIDANGHTNNSRYMAFILDALPVEYSEKTFTDVKVNYSKEAMFGETIKLYSDINDEARKITVIGKTDAVSFEAELYW